MTDDEIQDRVNRAPELARELIVPPAYFEQLRTIQLQKPKAEWEWLGFRVRSSPLLPPDFAVWLDKDGKVIATMRLGEET